MSKENAQKLFTELETNKELKEKLAGLENPADIVKAAVEAGYDVTESELIEAEKELRKQRAQKTDTELSADELEAASGGELWIGEDAPDGHELGCYAFFYHYEVQEERNWWCKAAYFCPKDSVIYNPNPTCH